MFKYVAIYSCATIKSKKSIYVSSDGMADKGFNKFHNLCVYVTK